MVDARYRLSLAALLSVPVLLGLFLHYGVIDDAYITLRYARNFTSGLGLVFNPGERVEGYTSILWVIAAAFLQRVTPLDYVEAAQLLSLVSGIALLLLTERVLGALGLAPRARLLLLTILATDFLFSFWIFSGMESPFHAFLMLLSGYWLTRALEEKTRRVPWLNLSAVALALAALTRPETYLFLFLNLGMIVHFAATRRRWQAAFVYAAVFASMTVPHLLWRKFYYGAWLPNTFYVKVDYSSAELLGKGLQYLGEGLLAYCSLIAASLWAFIRRREKMRYLEIYAAHFCVFQALVILYIGGDHFIQLRYFLVLQPFLLILLSPLLRDAPASAFRRRALVIISLALLSHVLAFQLDGRGYRSTFRTGRIEAQRWGKAGRWLRENVSSEALLATPVAGAMAFHAERPTLDMLGLNDAFIARKRVAIGEGPKDHEKFDARYVFSLKPDYVYINSRTCEPLERYRSDLPTLVPRLLVPMYEELFREAPLDSYDFLSVQYAGENFCFLKRR